MVRAGIIGGAGFTGGELIRILLGHPECEIAYVNSNSQAGKRCSDIHKDLLGETDMTFNANPAFDVDVLFLCLAHGDSAKFMKANLIPDKVAVIDLSQDFRLKNAGQINDFVYGLPEINRELIKKTRYVANPGCFATVIQLAVLPLAAGKMLYEDLHVTAITGSTGAGQKLNNTVHFTWRSNNISFYKVFEHQHLNEIRQTLIGLQTNWNKEIAFVPVRGNFTRGIMAGLYTKCDLTIDEVKNLYKEFYRDHPFTIVSENDADIKQVLNTNKCVLHLKKTGEQLFVTSVIDNLVKGASGQAVQNMNLIFGLDETCGLKLKPIAF